MLISSLSDYTGSLSTCGFLLNQYIRERPWWTRFSGTPRTHAPTHPLTHSPQGRIARSPPHTHTHIQTWIRHCTPPPTHPLLLSHLPIVRQIEEFRTFSVIHEGHFSDHLFCLLIMSVGDVPAWRLGRHTAGENGTRSLKPLTNHPPKVQQPTSRPPPPPPPATPPPPPPRVLLNYV